MGDKESKVFTGVTLCIGIGLFFGLMIVLIKIHWIVNLVLFLYSFALSAKLRKIKKEDCPEWVQLYFEPDFAAMAVVAFPVIIFIGKYQALNGGL